MIKTFIEPVMIISLAIVVGFILMAVLIPMFGIYGTVA
jgi:type II secretory pathway component PulF